MKKSAITICVSVILLLVIAGSIFLVFETQKPSLFLRVGKPIQFDNNGNISAEQQIVHTDRDSLDIILLSMVNAQPIPEDEYPTALPDARIWISYGATAYPYELWFYEDYIIFGNENTVYRKIQNDHNNPVPLIKELVESVK